ncbi:MAG: CYTH domain-containing protein [Prevotella sp.]|nr:CYTH domain-containing protein [Prevotella sp.]
MALEIERKFLVLDDSYKHEAFSSSHIRQGYICSERGRTVRIRIRDEYAYITIKGPSLDGGLSRYEFEQQIPLDDAEKLMTLCDAGIIDKTRWLVSSGEHTFEVDEFHGDNQGLVVAEVELKRKDETPKIPHFIGKEVTGDRRYYNSQLRRNPYTLWPKGLTD